MARAWWAAATLAATVPGPVAASWIDVEAEPGPLGTRAPSALADVQRRFGTDARILLDGAKKRVTRW